MIVVVLGCNIDSLIMCPAVLATREASNATRLIPFLVGSRSMMLRLYNIKLCVVQIVIAFEANCGWHYWTMLELIIRGQRFGFATV